MRLVKQLDGSRFASANCGPVSTSHALLWSTRGKVFRSPSRLRELLDGRWSGPEDATSLADQKRLWDGQRDDARDRGLVLPAYDRRVAADSQGIRDALDRDLGVVVQIDYKVLNERRPDVSGDRGFKGLHVVFVDRKRRRKDGLIEVRVWDGLHDGRTRGTITYARGPVWWPLHLLLLCAHARVRREIKGADNLATFAVIHRATPIPAKPVPVPPAPEPTPEPPAPDARIAELEAELSTVRDLLADAETTLAMHQAEHDELVEQVEHLAAVLGSVRTGLMGTADQVASALEDIEEVLGDDADPGDGDPADGVGQEAG